MLQRIAYMVRIALYTASRLNAVARRKWLTCRRCVLDARCESGRCHGLGKSADDVLMGMSEQVMPLLWLIVSREAVMR
jgi:hypothetical protein